MDNSSTPAPSDNSTSTSEVTSGDPSVIMLWMPYILLTVVLIALLLISFANFHYKFRHRYQKRKEESIALPKEQVNRALPGPLHLGNGRGLFALPPPGSSILPARGMIPIPEEDQNGCHTNHVAVDLGITETPVIPLREVKRDELENDFIPSSHGRHQSLTFTSRSTNAFYAENPIQSSGSDDSQRWVGVHSKPMRRMSISSTSSNAESKPKRWMTSKSSSSGKKIRTGLGLFSSSFNSR